MEDKNKIVIVAVITLAAMAIIGYVLINLAIATAEENQNQAAEQLQGETNKPSELDALAACLTEKGYSMMGAEWCSACKSQKSIFGDSFALIDYRDCDKDKDFCTENQVEYYPTWVAPDGTKIIGVQSPEKLAQMSSCEIRV